MDPVSRRLGTAVLTGVAMVAAGVTGYVVMDRLSGPGPDAPCPTTQALERSATLPPEPDPVAGSADPAEVDASCWPTAWPSAEEPTTPPPSTPTPEDTSAPEETTAPASVTAGPDTTGVPAGVTLTAVDPAQFDEDGLVLDGVLISGDVVLTGANQVVRNSRIEGHVAFRGTGQVLEDSEIGSLAVSGATSFRASRVDIFGRQGEDGIHVTSGRAPTSDIVIEDSWIHSPQVDPESHYDGIQVRGVVGLTLRGNTFDLGPWAPEYNAAVFLEDANGGNHDVVVERNFINGGGYSVYVEGRNVAFVDNVFGRGSRWGPLYPEHDAFRASGNVWADTGEPVDLS